MVNNTFYLVLFLAYQRFDFRDHSENITGEVETFDFQQQYLDDPSKDWQNLGTPFPPSPLPHIHFLNTLSVALLSYFSFFDN